MTCYRRKSTVWPGKLIESKKTPKNSVFLLTNMRYEHVIHIWKTLTLSYNLAYQEIILVHPTRRQIFTCFTLLTLLSGTSETFSYLH